jgi:RNA polymerase-binding transcription factor DksA
MGDAALAFHARREDSRTMPTAKSAKKSTATKSTSAPTAKAKAKAIPPAKKAPAVKRATTTTTTKAPAKVAKAPTAAKKAAPASTAAKKPAGATMTKKSTATAKPAAASSKASFDKKFLDEQREVLRTERAKYLRSAQILKDEADALVLEREPGDVQFDEESGEGDTLAVERDFDLALSAQARQQVDEIDAALARLDNGTYGICRVSGQPIPKERLRAIPWATERVEYKVGGLGRR